MSGQLLYTPPEAVMPCVHRCGPPDAHLHARGAVWRCTDCGQFYVRTDRWEMSGEYDQHVYEWHKISDRKARKIIGSRP